MIGMNHMYDLLIIDCLENSSVDELKPHIFYNGARIEKMREQRLGQSSEK